MIHIYHGTLYALALIAAVGVSSVALLLVGVVLRKIYEKTKP